MRSNHSTRTLLLPHIAAMVPYTPIEPFEVLSARLGRSPEQIVKLDANENPYGPHPAVREALAAYPFPHIYPDPEQRALREALADYTGVPAANIFPGHGADELIDLLCRVFLGPGDAIINCPPTFGMYEFDGAWRARAWSRAAAGRLLRGCGTNYELRISELRHRANHQYAIRIRTARHYDPSCSSSPRPTTPTAACSRRTTCGGCSTCP